MFWSRKQYILGGTNLYGPRESMLGYDQFVCVLVGRNAGSWEGVTWTLIIGMLQAIEVVLQFLH